MIVSILQTLAEILAGGTSLTSTEQIDFSRPDSRQNESIGPVLNLYFYDIRESKQKQPFGKQNEHHLLKQKLRTHTVNMSPSWFDVSLIVTAWDRTSLGECQLLSEALNLLLRHRSLQEEFLAPELHGYGKLPMTIAVTAPIEIGDLWSALSIPLRPALYLTVTVPFEAQRTQKPLVWERLLDLPIQSENHADRTTIAKQISVIGLVKDAVTKEPLAETKVVVMGTKKSVMSDREGLFLLEGLQVGSYILTLTCSGYAPQNCNVLIDNQTYTFKEVLLTPA
jgi:hypothetical protein